MNIFHRLCFLIGRLLRLIVKEICKKCQINIYGIETLFELAAKESCLLVAWHQHIPLVDYFVPPNCFKSIVLVDRSRDGKIASGLASFSKIIEVPTSHRKKHKALIRLMRHLYNERAVGVIAPDGPTGPARCVKPGSIAVAKKMKIKIVPCSFASSHYWALPTWDRMHLPKPGSRIAVLFGPPLDVSSLTLEEGAKALEFALNQLEKQAHESICSSR